MDDETTLSEVLIHDAETVWEATKTIVGVTGIVIAGIIGVLIG